MFVKLRNNKKDVNDLPPNISEQFKDISFAIHGLLYVTYNQENIEKCNKLYTILSSNIENYKKNVIFKENLKLIIKQLAEIQKIEEKTSQYGLNEIKEIIKKYKILLLQCK